MRTPLVAKLSKTRRDFVMKGRGFCFVDAELYDWNIRMRIDVAQHRPSTVIQCPALVAAHRHRYKQFLDARTELAIIGRVTSDFLQLCFGSDRNSTKNLSLHLLRLGNRIANCLEGAMGAYRTPSEDVNFFVIRLSADCLS